MKPNEIEMIEAERDDLLRLCEDQAKKIEELEKKILDNWGDKIIEDNFPTTMSETSKTAREMFEELGFVYCPMTDNFERRFELPDFWDCEKISIFGDDFLFEYFDSKDKFFPFWENTERMKKTMKAIYKFIEEKEKTENEQN